MKLKLYVNVDGLEQIALGEVLWPWHFTLQTNQYDVPPTGAVYLGEVDYELPKAEDCIAPVLAKLAAREQEIQAEAYREVQELKGRRENLLSLTYSPAVEA